jgi:hypothetical protein
MKTTIQALLLEQMLDSCLSDSSKFGNADLQALKAAVGAFNQSSELMMDYVLKLTLK